ncbi:unnamed protein product, partial [Symbiodinium natans]
EAAEDAENQVWQAKVTALRAQLEADQKAVKSMAAGHKVLRDQLDWMRHQRRSLEIERATTLVGLYTGWFHPVLNCRNLSEAAACYQEKDFAT